MKTLQECKDEVARSYQLHPNEYYTDWNQMEAWLISLSGENSRELFRREQEAKELYKRESGKPEPVEQERTLADIDLDNLAQSEWEKQPKFLWKSAAFKAGLKIGYKKALEHNQEYIDSLFDQHKTRKDS